MPLVAVFAPQVSDVLRSIFYRACDVGLFAVLLRLLAQKQVLTFSPGKRAFFVLFFSLGTPFTTLPAIGNVWYILQLVTLAVMFLAYIAGLSLRGEKALFGQEQGWRLFYYKAKLCSSNGFPCLVFASTVCWCRKKGTCWLMYSRCSPDFYLIWFTVSYNFSRFGDPLENGLHYHLMGEAFSILSAKYGQFSTHYIPDNFFFTYIFYPLDFSKLFTTPLGGSLFLLSPLFFWQLPLYGQNADLLIPGSSSYRSCLWIFQFCCSWGRAFPNLAPGILSISLFHWWSWQVLVLTIGRLCSKDCY